MIRGRLFFYRHPAFAYFHLVTAAICQMGTLISLTDRVWPLSVLEKIANPS